MSKFTMSSILIVITLLAVSTNMVHSVTQRNIPDTKDNQRYFKTTQYLINNGDFDDNECGQEQEKIVDCIKKCNRPGLRTRSGCCCVAQTDKDDNREFVVGLKGGCRYSQRVLNFTKALHYSSTPIKGNDNALFFNERNCEPSSEKKTTDTCKCEMEWRLSTKDLNRVGKSKTPVPTPTTSAETPEPVPESPEPTASKAPKPKPSSTTKEPVTVPPPQDDTTESDESSPTATPIPTENIPFPDVTSDPSVSPEDDGSVCVEEDYLRRRGFEASHMVHLKPLIANVLCPLNTTLPCGTHDHKVILGKTEMSYRQLCATKGFTCKMDVRAVNSIYSHLWSNIYHEGIVMTMYDIRYPEFAQRSLHRMMSTWRMIIKQLPTHAIGIALENCPVQVSY